MTMEDVNLRPNRDFIKLNSSNTKYLKKWIEDYIINTHYTFNAKDVTNFVNKELSKTYPVSFIRNFMRVEMKLTYKRVKPRPNNVDLSKLNWIRKLFSVKIAKSLSETTLVINMDQSSINRNMRSNRSWGFRGVEIESKNSSFSGSVSIWFSILSNGAWFWLLTSETIDSEKIFFFINHLVKWIRDNDSFNYSEILMILDNCSIQKSSKIKLQLKRLNWKVMYLPVYSPMYAPIENWFSLLKSHLKQNYKSENIKINLKQNFKTIYQALKSISAKTIKRLFGNLFARIRSNLSNLL